jgi:hypothetical protein
MLWGDAHVAPDGIGRFLPADAVVLAIHLLGGRAGEAGIERELAGRLHVTEPLLVPLGRDRLVLLLPAPPIGARLDRRRNTLGRPAETDLRERLVTTSTAAGTLHLRHGRFEVDETSRPIPLTAGTHAFLLETGDRLLTGSIEIPRLGYAELDLDSPAGIASTLVHRP